MNLSTEEILLLKSIFISPLSVSTASRLSSHLDDSFKTDTTAYISLITILQKIMNSQLEPLSPDADNFNDSCELIKELARESIELKLQELEIPVIYLAKRNPSKKFMPPDDPVALQNEIDEINKKSEDEAKKALQALASLPKMNDFTNFAKMKKQPKPLLTLLEAVCIACNHPSHCRLNHECIESPKELMMTFEEFKLNSTVPELSNQNKELITLSPELTLDTIKKFHKPFQGLYSWIISIIQYNNYRATSSELTRKLISLTETNAIKEHLNKIYQSANPTQFQSKELSKALAPLIDREYEIFRCINDLNNRISKNDSIRTLLLHFISQT